MPEKKSKFAQAIKNIKYLWESVLKPDGRGLIYKIELEKMKRRGTNQKDGRDYE